jgi:hypothetical protein
MLHFELYIMMTMIVRDDEEFANCCKRNWCEHEHLKRGVRGSLPWSFFVVVQCNGMQSQEEKVILLKKKKKKKRRKKCPEFCNRIKEKGNKILLRKTV